MAPTQTEGFLRTVITLSQLFILHSSLLQMPRTGPHPWEELTQRGSFLRLQGRFGPDRTFPGQALPGCLPAFHLTAPFTETILRGQRQPSPRPLTWAKSSNSSFNLSSARIPQKLLNK